MREISDRFGFDVDPDALVEDLPVGVQQRVEIIKALSRDAKVLVFDEPTAVLTPQETDELMRDHAPAQARPGTAIVFITHKLREVREVADRITVIRLGKVVGEASPTATQRRARLADGRPRRRADRRRRSRPTPGDAALVVDEPHRASTRTARPSSTTSSFEVRRGEILAIAGVQGNGQTELTEAILGPAGARRRARSPSTAASSIGLSASAACSTPGVGFVPEDRTEDGLVAEFTIAENLMLDRTDSGAVRARAARCSST